MCSSGKFYADKTVETAETVVIQLLAKASIFKYRAMATNTQVLLKFCHYLSNNILLSHLLWMWTLVQSMGVTKDSEVCNVSWGTWMKTATQWAREAHFSAPSWFLGPSQIWNKDFWENVTFNTSVNYIIKHFTEGLRNSREKWQKRQKHIKRFYDIFEIHRWICQKFGKWRILSKTNYAIITFYLCLSNLDVENFWIYCNYFFEGN